MPENFFLYLLFVKQFENKEPEAFDVYKHDKRVNSMNG